MSQPYTNILGNSVDIPLHHNDPSVEIRADVKVNEFTARRIWGQVTNCADEPQRNALVKLVRVCVQNGRKVYEGVAHTVTDCDGFYQFDICQNSPDECYKIIVNKATVGVETVILTNGGNCNPCEEDTTCQVTPPVVKPYEPCQTIAPCSTNPGPGPLPCPTPLPQHPQQAANFSTNTWPETQRD
ncbi:MAG: hypothetical protein ACRC5C_13830 [Bacilli bacterium]